MNALFSLFNYTLCTNYKFTNALSVPLFLHYVVFYCAERGLSQRVLQTNVDDNKTDLEVALSMSLSDGAAVSDFPVCPLCDEPYSRETGYNNHVTTLHNPSVQKNCYNCTQCNVRFYSRKLYKQHKKGHERRQSWGQTSH